MKWLYSIVAVMMLAVWLPATSLCLVERAGWVPNEVCCSTESNNTPKNSSDTTACCTLAAAVYKTNDEKQTTVVHAPLLPLTFAKFPDFAPRCEAVSLIIPETSPTELTVGWQFSLRAAPSPRAPSIVS